MHHKELSDSFQATTTLYRPRLSFSEASVKALNIWTGSLAMLQLGDTAEAVLRALSELSELDCAETLRFDLIQVIHPLVEHVLLALEKHFVQQTAHYSDRQNHLIELNTRIRLYFTHIYIDIAYRSHHQLLQLKRSMLNFGLKNNLKTARILASYYALQQLAQLQVQQQKQYSNSFVDQWQSTHQLYRLACKNEEHLININQLQGSHYPLKHIQHAYVQVLLLDIFNTYQIRAEEIEALLQCSAEWVSLVDVSHIEMPMSRYIIDTHQDLPPIYNQKQHQAFFHPDLFLATQSLLEHINTTIQHDAKFMSETEREYLTPALQFHIQNVLGTNHAERRYQRYAYSAQLQLCFSVKAAHFNLTHDAPFDPQASNGSEAVSSNTAEQSMTLFSSELDREALQIYTTQVLDISLHGYRVHWTQEQPKLLNTGEFIILREHEDQAWKAGVIRWMKQSVAKTYAIGLEVLADQMIPCRLELTQQDVTVPSRIDGLNGMVLYQSQSLRPRISVVIPNGEAFNENAQWLLKIATLSIALDLKNILLITQSFIQFEFKARHAHQQQHLLDLLQSDLKSHTDPTEPKTQA
ncbi:hypothetical protein EC844_1077 [Acinetobacter calcoaceticus]|uniref:GTPase n=1 Tax=Acinetobacter calcoaceticus TaxID=471 RepID=A0A4R1Y6D8_ACICA|nr:hypothetical protein EC844_1077 [Acinetobacter calcoaceticus]